MILIRREERRMVASRVRVKRSASGLETTTKVRVTRKKRMTATSRRRRRDSCRRLRTSLARSTAFISPASSQPRSVLPPSSLAREDQRGGISVDAARWGRTEELCGSAAARSLAHWMGSGGAALCLVGTPHGSSACCVAFLTGGKWREGDRGLPVSLPFQIKPALVGDYYRQGAPDG
jgi:hypothetical protein